ncbi:DNA-3-methyladenine glycosylase [Amnibacterium sp.]|uniref:DNA-3-methyladenine glycosylase n=1 Tax=Amnibacterium sp. TaxID=1872496 RepID=UPI003F7C1A12
MDLRQALEAPALEVAPMLLGAVLAHRSSDGTVAVRLTEVEAYEGEGQDPGSHAHRGRTRRNATMFGRPGLLYTYFTYGMHTCANLVCLPEGRAAAVLLRAGEVVAGAELASFRRGGVPATRLARGPANLASALGITLADDGADVLAGEAFSIDPDPEDAARIVAGPRVGVSGEGGSDAYPWRFRIAGEPTVSAYRPAVARVRSA